MRSFATTKYSNIYTAILGSSSSPVWLLISVYSLNMRGFEMIDIGQSLPRDYGVYVFVFSFTYSHPDTVDGVSQGVHTA